MEMLEYYTENMFGLLESPVRAKLPCLFKNDKYAVLYAPKTRDGCSSIIMVSVVVSFQFYFVLVQLVDYHVLLLFLHH